MKHVEVVAAVIKDEANRFLCTQRPENKLPYLSKKFEFPGGKIELGESREEALKREIREELNLDINIINPLVTVEHQYPDFLLTMHSFLCTSGTEKIQLAEHLSFKWLSKDELMSLDWAAADIPIVHKLIRE